MQLFELKKQREVALQRADAILRAAETDNRRLSAAENEQLTAATSEASALGKQIEAREKQNDIRRLMSPSGHLITEARQPNNFNPAFRHPAVFSADYPSEFLAHLASRGQKTGATLADGADPFGFGGHLLVGPQQKMGAILNEGTNSAGGFAVPSIVEPQIVPLAPPAMAVRKIASVMPTSMDIKFPRKDSFGAATLKTEGSLFLSTQPTIGQQTLTAYMLGGYDDASWELLQDVQTFQTFIVDDLLTSIAVLEEGYFVSGTGSGQPEGLLGNVGAGVSGEVADGSGNLLSIQATYDVMGTLSPFYDNANTCWLMAKASGIELRKAQMQANLFAPVWTREGNQDYLHGYPVYYSASMPAIAAGATPVLYGDFKSAYVIGDRGGSGIYVKFLDQVVATNGELRILAYRRTDGKVRRSEAVQGITLHT